jgi:GDP-D-mannose dehydratase
MLLRLYDMSLATLRETSVAVLLEGLRHVRRDAKFYFAGSSGVKWGLNPKTVDPHF